MNDNAKKWVEALRSGKYKQTTGVLKRKGKFCCLGVACDLYGKKMGIRWHIAKDYDGIKFDFFMQSNTVLPRDVADWLGLHEVNGFYGNKPGESLSSQNDSGMSFADIATLIERMETKLFRPVN